MNKVDIVVPIYNAYEYTDECIKSVIKNTDLTIHRLILINDKSPDEKILPMLKGYVEKNRDKQIILLENEENMGFVKTVNYGMTYSNENDVLLLNSDTEVTKNWIEKITRCAYSNDYIATVTPLTNNGTICSVPNFGVDNELPTNMTMEEYADLIEKCSLKRFPELSTAHGYCMFIKRSVIEEIGVFDDETFGKGYGEENDFCYRAFDYGYTHVLCDDTFIYHKGTQSFTSTRKELVMSHMKILKNRYPTYVYGTDKFIADNPIRDIQENVKLNISLYKKKKVLFLIHEWEEDLSKLPGGTSLHLLDLINGIKKDITCLVLAPNKYDINEYILYIYNGNEKVKIFSYKINKGYGLVKYTSNEYKEMLDSIIKGFKIDILHVQHMIHQTFDIAKVVQENNIYSVITLHDLYMICPTINMIYKDKYCEKREEKNCVKCLNERLKVSNDILNTWQKEVNKFLKSFDKVLVPSDNTKMLYQKVYNDLDIEVFEHGVDIEKYEEKVKEKKINKNSKEFNIAFIGVMTIHKGSKILREFIKLNKESKSIKIHLFGNSEDKKLLKNKSRYVYHGRYKRDELPKLLKENNIDLVCIFSIWPETYSYTLTETFIAGVPVIAYDLGAVGDRIEKSNLGYLVDYSNTPNDIFSKIIEISKDKAKHEEIKSNFLSKSHVISLNDMISKYIDLYSSLNSNSLNFTNINVIDYDNVLKFTNKNISRNFENYKNTYGHVVHKYETLRKTKMWKIGKRLKKNIRENFSN